MTTDRERNFAGCLLSIVIPTRNSEALLPRCLESILQQGFSDFEIIVVDGASTDGTCALIRKLAARHENIRWVSEQDEGVYDAMNKGIALARGQWLYFLGTDDSLHDPTVLQRVAPHLDGTADFVYGNVMLENDPWGRDGTVYAGEFRLEDIVTRNICHQSIFYSSRIFRTFDLYDLRYKVFSDWELNLRLFTKVRKKYIPVTIANFHGGGLSSAGRDPEFELHFVEILTHELSLDPHSPIYRDQARGLRRLWEHYGLRGRWGLAYRYFRLWLRHERFVRRRLRKPSPQPDVSASTPPSLASPAWQVRYDGK